MLSILAPATALMRRLKYPEKFALVGCLFIIPLLVVFVLLMREIHHTRAIAERELAGTRYLRALNGLLGHLQQHRALSAAVSGGAVSLRHARAETEERIQEAMQAVGALDAQLGAALTTGGRWPALQRAWLALRDRYRTLPGRESARQHTILIARLLDFVRYVGDSSTLLLDPEVHSHHLMEIVVNRLPMLAEHIAQLHGWGTGVAARMVYGGSERYELLDLNGLIGAGLLDTRRDFSAAFESAAGLRPLLEPSLNETITETRRYLRLVMGRLLATGAEQATAEELWASGTAALERAFRLYDRTSAVLDRIVAARIRALRRQERLVAVLALSALLAVLYLFAGFYRGVTDTVTKLDTFAKRMLAGKIRDPAPLPDSKRDELVIVSRAFASLAERLRSEWLAAQEKHAEAVAAALRLEEREAHTQAIMDTAADGIICIDDDGIIRSFNSAAKMMFGYSAAEVVGRNVSILMPSPDREHHDKYLERYRRTGLPTVIGQRREVEGVRADGSRFPISLAVSEMTWDGQRMFTGIVTDLSAQRETEEELRRAQRAALEATRLTSASLTNIGHALRTPLNGILGMADLLGESPLPSEQHEFVETIRAEADSLVSVLSDVLDFAKLEAGTLALERAPFSLRETLRDTVKPFAIQAHRKGVEVVCDVAASVPEALTGDAGRLRQVLVKLIENAVKFTAAGEIVVRAEREGTGPSAPVVRFSISDTGPGIPAEKLATVFTPFAGREDGQARQHGGTGLGLAVASRLVAILGGELRVESVLGRGSAFQFAVPLAVDEARPALVPPAPRALWGRPVLVVENNASARRGLCAQLEAWNAQPVAISDAEAALAAAEAAAAGGRPFVLAFIDAQLPGVNGFALARRIRERPTIAALPILLLTSSGQRSDFERAEQLAAGCRTKPFLLTADVRDFIAEVVSGATASSPARSAERSPAGGHLRILLAEDDDVSRLVAARLLERAGHIVTAVGNGRLALDALERDRYDAVVMDVQMPEMDGLEATAAIRAREVGGGNHIPIIALTAYAMTGDQERCLQAGMDAYVTKPVRAPALLATIDRLVRQGRRQPDAAAPAEMERRGIDRGVLRRRMGDDRRALLDLARHFQEESREILDALREGVARGDAAGIERHAHRLRAALRTVAATGTRAVALRLEAAARVGDLEQAARTLAVLESEIRLLEPELAALGSEEGV
jgi:PAS domain S-box-containing protein